MYRFQKRIDNVERLWDEHKNLVGLGNQPLSVTIGAAPKALLDYVEDFSMGTLQDQIIFTDDKQECLRGVQTLFNELESQVFPFLRKLDDIDYLNRICNNPIENFKEINTLFNAKGLAFRKMIIASLANDVNFEKICQVARNRIKKSWAKSPERLQKYLEVYPKIYEALKSDVN